ncbi:MAG: hypothetical protein KDJ65_31000 [Anaerolineae bacterium]|nr:hypothetical protein [Anaerolineae bacterium]
MPHFSVRISGGIALLLQAFLLQFLWTPNSSFIGETPIFFSITPAVFLALLATLWFVFLRGTGWILAMMVQSICLLTGLYIRFWQPSWSGAAQLTMLYSILMVLYLNAHSIRSAFEPWFQNGKGQDTPL